MKIKNLLKSVVVLNLPHSPTCQDTGTDCPCSLVKTALAVEDEDGTRGVRMLERRLGGSVTILASETTELPDWIGETKPFKDAVAKRWLRLVE